MNASLSPSQSRRLLHAPRVLFFVALAALLAGAFAHWRAQAPLPALALLGAYFAWMMYEIPVTFQGATALKDARTLVPYALARIAVIATCGLVASAAAPWLGWIALALFVGGVALREIAIKTLGRFYTHHVARRSDQVAVTRGPYRFIRHPAYLGMLAAHVGLALGFPHPLSAAALALLFAAVIWRIRVEERALLDMPGYAEYAARTPRLWPGLW